MKILTLACATILSIAIAFDWMDALSDGERVERTWVFIKTMALTYLIYCAIH